MTVELDKIQDAVIRQGARGIEVTRRAILRDIGGPPQLRQRAALEAPGLPRYGDRHPAWGDLRVASIELVPVDVSTWEAAIIYRDPTTEERLTMEPPGTVLDRTWFSVTVSEEVTQDIRGENLYHWYSGKPLTPIITAGRVTFSRGALTFLAKNESAEIQRPSVGVRVTLVEAASVRERINVAATTNVSYWSGYPPQTWLLGGMESREEQGRWLNVYQLFYNPDTWRFRSTVEYYGRPPDDATLGNGIAEFDVYRQSNFNLLGFSV